MTIVFALRSTPVHSLRPWFMAHTSRVSVLRRTSSMACRRPRLFRPPKTCHWRCCSWRCCCPGDVRSGQCASGHLDHGNIIYIYIIYIYVYMLAVFVCLAMFSYRDCFAPPMRCKKILQQTLLWFWVELTKGVAIWPFAKRWINSFCSAASALLFFLAARKYTNNLMCFCPAWRDMDESYGGGEEQSQEISNGAKRHRSYCANKYKEQIQCLCSISQICCLKNI